MDLELTYFDFHGGRGEPARLALHIGGVPFKDTRIAPQDFPALKLGYPFGTLPTLRVGERIISQSNAILRFVGQRSGLYPTEALEAACCDELMEALEDMNHKFAHSLHIADPEKLRERRLKILDGPLTFTLERVAALLERRGGEYFADGRLTVADLKCFVWVRALCRGTLDHIPTDLVERLAPTLMAHHARVAAHPGVVGYYAALGA
jgi:glutathione S-transferase